MNSRQQISRAITAILNAAESVEVTYSEALGFFNTLDFQLILKGEYGPEQIEHALRHGVQMVNV